MATNPKISRCPNCQSDEQMAVYTYDSGWKHVECTKCNYLGPGETSIRQAIKSHNEKFHPSPAQRQSHEQARIRRKRIPVRPDQHQR